MHFENISHYASLLLYAIMISTLFCSLLTYFVYKLRQRGNAVVNSKVAVGNVRELSSHPSFSARYSDVTLVTDLNTEFQPVRARKMLRFG